MAQIERREARLRKIRRLTRIQNETVPKTPQEHHHIGISQNQYKHIRTFLREHSGDPAVKVREINASATHNLISFVPKNFLPKLEQHLLARIRATIHENSSDQNDTRGQVLFRHDRIYQHKLMRINYTTYDVRRCQDVVHEFTPHCNIMVLEHDEGGRYPSTHPYGYAKILGIYHANAMYVGPGMVDYQPRRMEFLWVRWYRRVEAVRTGWDFHKLDRVQFSPVGEEDAFGFIDPSDVLRSCHLIPAFSKGKAHVDGKGLSVCAQDSSDWAAYYVMR